MRGNNGLDTCVVLYRPMTLRLPPRPSPAQALFLLGMPRGGAAERGRAALGLSLELRGTPANSEEASEAAAPERTQAIGLEVEPDQEPALVAGSPAPCPFLVPAFEQLLGGQVPLPLLQGARRYYCVFPFPSVPGLRTGVYTGRGSYVRDLLVLGTQTHTYSTFRNHPFLRCTSLATAVATFEARAQEFSLDPSLDLNFVDLSTLPLGEPEWTLPLLVNLLVDEQVFSSSLEASYGAV